MRLTAIADYSVICQHYDFMFVYLQNAQVGTLILDIMIFWVGVVGGQVDHGRESLMNWISALVINNIGKGALLHFFCVV